MKGPAPRPAVKAALIYLTCTAAVVGVWAQAAPRSFYKDFPGVRRFWISLDGPYNEHLIRDVGGLNLSLALLTIAAVVVHRAGLPQLAALCWLVFGLPHLAYHLLHLEPFEPLDAVAQSIALTTQVLVPMGILASTSLLGGREDRKTRLADQRA